MNTPTLLLVEDNLDDEELTRLALAQSGVTHTLALARDGAQALDWLFRAGPYSGRNGSQPAVVLLDLKLPKVDGFEVLHRMRADERTRSIPVVVLSTSLEPRDLARCYAARANGYVRKPVDFDEFAAALRLVAKFWLELNQVPFPIGKNP